MNNQEWNSYINSNSSGLVDVSSFWLFESTGDSEFDSNICSTSDDLPIPSHQRFLEDDDAQSCSYDEDMDLDFKIENDDNDDDDGDVDANSRCSSGFHHKSIGWNSNIEDEDEDDEDEGGVVEQRWMNNGVNRSNEKLKSNVCSSVVVDCELKSQKDKDKLFWETCLAS